MTTNDDIRWTAVQQHDAAHDGEFFYGVMTTGVFCRPSCGARTPLRRNVRFYATTAEAERDGLRACKRCKPLETRTNDPIAERIREVCARIAANAGEPLPLKTLAAEVGMSPFHLQRSFKAIVGVTPKAFQQAERLRMLKSGLKSAASVTDAIYDAGFGSSSRVYEHVDTQLGMTPRQYREGGKGLTISYAGAETALGRLLIGATDRGICFLQFADNEKTLIEQLALEYPAAERVPMAPAQAEQFATWMRALGEYLKGREPRLDLPLDVRGTAFQLTVWRYLQSIPYGEVQSYGEVARGIGRPNAVRAVANACAHNAIALAIPCHRVIRGSGELGGYRWGLERKRTLLDRERAGRASGAVRAAGRRSAENAR